MANSLLGAQKIKKPKVNFRWSDVLILQKDHLMPEYPLKVQRTDQNRANPAVIKKKNDVHIPVRDRVENS